MKLPSDFVGKDLKTFERIRAEGGGDDWRHPRHRVRSLSKRPDRATVANGVEIVSTLIGAANRP
jgi:hypothetical protein